MVLDMYDRAVDRIIREAMEAGEFDNLEGKGKPIDHTSYFSAPADSRLGYASLKNSGFVPEEVELLKQIEVVAGKLGAETDEARIRSLKIELRDTRLKLDLMLERRRLKK